MIMKSIVLTTLVIAGLSVSACNRTPQKKSEPVKQQVVVPKPTLESLDKRVSAIEERNAKVDARIKASRVKVAH